MTEDNRRQVALLKDPAWFLANKHVGKLEYDNDRADPRMDKFARAFLKACFDHGIPAMCTEIYRGPERQEQLRRDGFSRASFGESAHNYGKAADIVHAIKAWDMTKPQWALFGVIGKEIARRQDLKVVWGGDWKSFWDPAHWELASWRQE